MNKDYGIELPKEPGQTVYGPERQINEDTITECSGSVRLLSANLPEQLPPGYRYDTVFRVSASSPKLIRLAMTELICLISYDYWPLAMGSLPVMLPGMLLDPYVYGGQSGIPVIGKSPRVAVSNPQGNVVQLSEECTVFTGHFAHLPYECRQPTEIRVIPTDKLLSALDAVPSSRISVQAGLKTVEEASAVPYTCPCRRTHLQGAAETSWSVVLGRWDEKNGSASYVDESVIPAGQQFIPRRVGMLAVTDRKLLNVARKSWVRVAVSDAYDECVVTCRGDKLFLREGPERLWEEPEQANSFSWGSPIPVTSPGGGSVFDLRIVVPSPLDGDLIEQRRDGGVFELIAYVIGSVRYI